MVARLFLVMLLFIPGRYAAGQDKFDIELSRIFGDTIVKASMDELTKYAQVNKYSLFIDSSLLPASYCFVKTRKVTGPLKGAATYIELSDSIYVADAWYTNVFVISDRLQYTKPGKPMHKRYDELVTTFKKVSKRYEQFDLYAWGSKAGEGMKFYRTAEATIPDVEIHCFIWTNAGFSITISAIKQK